STTQRSDRRRVSRSRSQIQLSIRSWTFGSIVASACRSLALSVSQGRFRRRTAVLSRRCGAARLRVVVALGVLLANPTVKAAFAAARSVTFDPDQMVSYVSQ